ncbi:hypothetical protein [Ferruginibacter sp.]
MKSTPLLALATAVLYAATAAAQNNASIKPMPAANLRVADSSSIKIQKLQDEVAELKQTVDKLVTKSNQDHLELGLAKISLKVITEQLTPTAYGALNPEYDKKYNGYSYKIGLKYGVTGDPVQSNNSITVTFSHNFDETPVILTAVSEDHINNKNGISLGIITYEFLPPNRVRFTVNEAKASTVIAPFSFVVYGK